MNHLNFYKDKVVLVTGHTGFKGSWLCKILTYLGAKVVGYSLNPPTNPNLYSIAEIGNEVESVIDDVRDADALERIFNEHLPEIVFHLAAQPLVRKGYENPRTTFETNVMGTVNILECLRKGKSVKSFVNVTTDKVYSDMDWFWGYRETDILGGHDPYSNSKSCSESVTKCYSDCFFRSMIPISTVRAGNVIGGGDFAEDRIIPDCIRAAIKGDAISIRNPKSVRPYQHVLEPLFAYLMIAERQHFDRNYAGNYNIGPDEADCVCTEDLVKLFCNEWGSAKYNVAMEANAPKESNFLRLDCSKLKQTFGWSPRMNIQDAVRKTVEWTKAYYNGSDANETMMLQIEDYISKING